MSVRSGARRLATSWGLGPLQIGDGSRIEADTVVTSAVPPFRTVSGAPGTLQP